MDTIGERLRTARLGRALTQDALAQESGVEKATISRIENNLTTPRPSTARKLAIVLGVEPGWLLVGDAGGHAASEGKAAA